MQKQSYDVPAYRFGIVKINDSIKRETNRGEDYQEALLEKECIVIPFESVDGLTIAELKNFIGTKEIFFISYLYYEDFNLNQNYNIVLQVYIDERFFEREPQTTIDEAVEKTLEKCYNHFDTYQKKVCQCFFERYQDKKYEITKARIKRLEENKN